MTYFWLQRGHGHSPEDGQAFGVVECTVPADIAMGQSAVWTERFTESQY